ncbi:MAG: Lhr family helicase, partial [Rudaea sp.]
IPDNAAYTVVAEPEGKTVGTLDEDFAMESLTGDVFLLGTHSWRIRHVMQGRVYVDDAHGAAPSIPFWLGEAPGRSKELSAAVSQVRLKVLEDPEGAWLKQECGLDDTGARQMAAYVRAGVSILGALPTSDTVVAERFFDEAGGMQLVLHAPFGSRVNRAWGLALRKRFCRKFNFELQAAATEDAIILSLSTSHSFPLDDVARYLHSNNVRDVLTQALLDAPMFGLRWRWNATTSLALPRFVGGAKVPPQLQRMKSEDLLATVFPDQVACAENLVGERQIPEHPLVAQTLHDCLHAAMDIAGLERLLAMLESGQIHIVARDLTAPSPLAAEVLNARPYAFLDDAPLEERRTQAVQSRRWGDFESTDDFGKLDADAITAVREEAWPQARNTDELHEALMGLGFLSWAEIEANGWQTLLDNLVANRRATQIFSASRATGEKASFYIAAERLPQFQAIFPEMTPAPLIEAPAEYAATEWTRETALADIVRGRLTGLGPVRAAEIAASLHIPQVDIDSALAALEREGFVMRGRFTPGLGDEEMCERHLLARIHRYTVKRLRREIEAVEPRDFLRFLFEWQHVAADSQLQGPDALATVLAQLEGFEAPAAAWEAEILPARVNGYEISWLDDLCLSGRVVWSRLRPRASGSAGHGVGPVRATPVVLVQRRNLPVWNALGVATDDALPSLSSRAGAVAQYLREHGASFFDELLAGTSLLHVELEEALAELVAAGMLNSDSFAGLRALLVPQSKRPSPQRRRSRRTALLGIADAGRWSLLRPSLAPTNGKTPQNINVENVEYFARTLLKRYGVVCWRLLAREAAWLPPWRELLRTFQRLEARGEIRGGRFIAGLSGEQFALPEAIGLLRSVRQKPHNGTLVAVCGADPLNLVGNLVAGANIPALTGTRVLYRDGAPTATLVAGVFMPLEPMDATAEWKTKSHLLRGAAHAPVATDAVMQESVD